MTELGGDFSNRSSICQISTENIKQLPSNLIIYFEIKDGNASSESGNDFQIQPVECSALGDQSRQFLLAPVKV
jgi:hypothetical protein